MFNVNIYSDELEAGNLFEELESYDDMLIDLRPYMIEEPYKI